MKEAIKRLIKSGYDREQATAICHYFKLKGEKKNG